MFGTLKKRFYAVNVLPVYQAHRKTTFADSDLQRSYHEH